MQAVRQLDEQHADILGHGEQEFAQVLRRALVFRHGLDLGELGHAVDQPRHLGSEIGLDILDRGQRVFDRVMKQRGHDCFLIELQISHQTRHFDRMREIGVPARALLGAVFLHGVDIGTVQHRLIGGRVVILDLFYKFVLAQH